MKNILVTGGNGFIGSILSKRLSEKGYDVSITSRKNQKNISTRVFDPLDNTIPQNIFKNIDVVYHLLALTHDVKGKINSNLYDKINFQVTKNLAIKASNDGVKSFVFLSSTKAMGMEGKNSLIKETNQNPPPDSYGKSKRMAEEFLLKFNEQTKMKIIIIRAPLVYGPGVKGNLKNLLVMMKHPLIPVIRKSNKRSMVSVYSLCEALIFLNDYENLKNIAYIVTDNKEYSIYDICVGIKLCTKNSKYFTIPNWTLYFLGYLGNILNVIFEFPLDISRVRKLMSNEYYENNEIRKIGFNSSSNFYDMLPIIMDCLVDKKNI